MTHCVKEIASRLTDQFRHYIYVHSELENWQNHSRREDIILKILVNKDAASVLVLP